MSHSDQSVSLYGYLSVMFLALAATVIVLVVFYAEKGFPWHTYLTCIMGYFVALGVIICVPVDVGSIVQDRTSTLSGQDPTYNYDVTTLINIYTTFYIIILVLCGIIMPVEEYYNTDGYFTFLWKLFSSIKRMLFDTAAALVVGLIILIILLAEKVLPPNGSALLLATVLLTNTIYELFLMFLLGYGLVSLPMTLWSYSDNEGRVLAIQNSAAASFKGVSEASFFVSEAVADVYKTKEALASYGDMALKDAIDILVAECPPEFKSSTAGKVATDKKGKVTIHTLAALRTRLNVLKDRFRMAKSHLEKIKRLAYTLEDIAVAAKRSDGERTIFWSLRNKESSREEYNWYVRTRPLLFKLGAVVAAVFSLFSYLGVVGSMHNVNSNVSVYFLAVHSPSANGAGVVVFVLVTFGYAAYVAFWALFQIRVAGLMELVPFSTTPESLSFNVRMVARLASPLAYFYLGWLWEGGTKYSTDGGGWGNNNGNPPIAMPSAFARFYNIQVLPGLGDAFGTAFPAILFAVSFLTLTNLLNRILVLCKMESYQFGTELVTEEQLKEGKRQLERNKKSTARTVQRENLRERIIDIAKNDKTGVVTSFASLFTIRETDREHPPDDDEVSAALQEPPKKEGPIERKGGKNSFGLETGWKEEYAAIRSPGLMFFFKDRNRADSGAPPDFQVNLSLALSFNEVSLGAKGQSLVIDLPDSEVKLRFKAVDDMKAWKSVLIQWKDYSVDYAETHRGTAVKLDEQETLSPFAGMHAGGNKGVYDLDSVEIGEFTENEPEIKKKGLFSTFFGEKKKKDEGLDSINVDAPPDTLEGWLEKKVSGKLHIGGSGDWDRMFAVVDEAKGILEFYKSQSKSKAQLSSSVDLKLVTDISPYFDKKGISTPRFNISVDDKVYKFKVGSISERDRWMKGLSEWRDYALLNHGDSDFMV